jgi:hypothetical protein
MNTNTRTVKTETVGRKYQKIRFGVQSRRIGEEHFRGFPAHYKTLEEAKAALAEVGKPMLGGLVSFEGEGEDLREYRIVREVSECEVVHIEKKKV